MNRSDSRNSATVSESDPTRSSTCQDPPLGLSSDVQSVQSTSMSAVISLSTNTSGDCDEADEITTDAVGTAGNGPGAALEDDALASMRRRMTGSSVTRSSSGRLVSLRNKVSANRARPISSPAIDSSMRARHAGVCGFATVSKRAASHPGTSMSVTVSLQFDILSQVGPVLANSGDCISDSPSSHVHLRSVLQR